MHNCKRSARGSGSDTLYAKHTHSDIIRFQFNKVIRRMLRVAGWLAGFLPRNQRAERRTESLNNKTFPFAAQDERTGCGDAEPTVR